MSEIIFIRLNLISLYLKNMDNQEYFEQKCRELEEKLKNILAKQKQKYKNNQL